MNKTDHTLQQFQTNVHDQTTGPGRRTSTLECNVCFEDAFEPVVTQCGHIYCWRCIYKWLRLKEPNSSCPTCNAVTDIKELIPIYSKSDRIDTRKHDESIPERPKPAREERKKPDESEAGQNRTRNIFNHMFAANRHGFNHPPTVGNNSNARKASLLAAVIPMLILIVFSLVTGVTSGSIYDMSTSCHDAAFLVLIGIFLCLGVALKRMRNPH